MDDPVSRYLSEGDNSVDFEAFAGFKSDDFFFGAPQESDFRDVLEDIIATKGISTPGKERVWDLQFSSSRFWRI